MMSVSVQLGYYLTESYVKVIFKYVPKELFISPDKARKGVIYPLKTGIYALVGISERTFTR